LAKTVLRIGSRLDLGMVRENQEDSLGIYFPPEPAMQEEKGALFLVCDGVGGHAAGDVASAIAVETLTSAYYAASANTVEDSLRVAVTEANRRVLEEAAKRPAQNGMGSTCVCVALRGTHIGVANVGDSRAYLLRGDRLVQLSQDHSWIAEQVRSGMMNEQDARNSQFRNVITQALGGLEQVSPSVRGQDLRAGDVLLLCSDGLTTMLEDREIMAFLQQYDDPQEACDALTDAANQRGGKDNISMIIARIDDLGQPTSHQQVVTSDDLTANAEPPTLPTNTGAWPMIDDAPQDYPHAGPVAGSDHADTAAAGQVATASYSALGDRQDKPSQQHSSGRLVPGPASSSGRLAQAVRLAAADAPAPARRNLPWLAVAVLAAICVGLAALWLLLNPGGFASNLVVNVGGGLLLIALVGLFALRTARRGQANLAAPTLRPALPPLASPSMVQLGQGEPAFEQAFPPATAPATAVAAPEPAAFASSEPGGEQPVILELSFPFGSKEHDVQAITAPDGAVLGSCILSAPPLLLGSEDELAEAASRGFWLTLYERRTGESSVAILLSPRAYSDEWSTVTAELPQGPLVRFADIKTIRDGLSFSLSVGHLTASIIVTDCHYLIAGRQRTPDRYLDHLILRCTITIA